MVESFLAVPLHFTVEFVGFLVAAGAAFLVPSRSELVPGRFNRAATSLGFALLAAAQLVHGAAFVPLDGDPQWALVRAAGFALIWVGVLGVNPHPQAAVMVGGIEIREPMLLAPAATALLLGISAFAAAGKSGLSSMRRLGFGALMIAAAEALTSLAPGARIDTGSAHAAAYAAHGLRLAAYVAIGAWLWTGARSSIRSKFVAAFAALLVLVVLALSAALTGVISNNVEREELGRLETQVGNSVGSIRRETDDLLGDARTLSSLTNTIQRPLAQRRNLSALAEGLVEQGLFAIEMDFVILTDRRGDLLQAAGYGPRRSVAQDPHPLTDRKLQRLLGSPVLLDVAGGAPFAAGLDRVDPRTLAVVAGHEVRNPDGRGRAGIIVIGRYLDILTAEEVSVRVGTAQATILGGDGQIVASTFGDRVQDEFSVPAEVRDRVQIGETASVRHVMVGRPFFSSFSPLADGRGVPVATLVLSSPAGIVAETQEDVIRSLFLVALGVGAVALALAWLSGRRITEPIQSLTRTARAVREGDLSAQVQVSGEDEVGQLGETFNEMTEALLRMTDDLRAAVLEEGLLRTRIETIIQSMADGLVAIDADHHVLAFNIEAELLTGIKAADALGQPVEDVLEVVDAQGDYSDLPLFDLSEGSVGGIHLVRRFGDPVPVAVTSAVLRGEDDEVIGGVAVIRDVSREHEIERMKSEFLSNISHELRTPLTPIKGYAEILGRKDVPPEKVAQFARGITESTARLERIVELLVDFSAMEAGRLAPRSAPVELRDLLNQVASEWGGRSKRHSIEVEVEDDTPPVSGDERLLKRSVEEILDNAFKFSPSGGKVLLRAQPRSFGNGSAPPGLVDLTITDEGIGISSEDLPKIFSDFHQLDGSETRSYGGLGLGLAFVRRIVEVHGGEITVESEVDRGTSFILTLPVARKSKAAEDGEGAPSGVLVEAPGDEGTGEADEAPEPDGASEPEAAGAGAAGDEVEEGA